MVAVDLFLLGLWGLGVCVCHLLNEVSDVDIIMSLETNRDIN